MNREPNSMKTTIARVVRYYVLGLLFLCPLARADVIATYATTDLGAGLFQYTFAIDNTTGTIPISGLLIEQGNSLFGVDTTSTISAPAGWGFLSPLPPFDDLLAYFPFSPATNIPIGSSLAGFAFDSLTDPSTLPPFDVILVGSDSSQTPYEITPEPNFLVLSAALLTGLGIKRYSGRAKIRR